MWKPSTIMEAAERGCCGCIETADVETADDDMDVLSDISLNKPYKPTKRLNTGKYSFQPYAYPRNSLSDWERVMCKSTLECYQKHFNLKVGVYVQGKHNVSSANHSLQYFFVNRAIPLAYFSSFDMRRIFY